MRYSRKRQIKITLFFMRAVILLLSIMFFWSPQVAAQDTIPGKGDDAPSSGRYPWHVVNNCHEEINIALTHFKEGRWITKGWFQVPSGSQRIIPNDSEYIVYLATSISGMWYDKNGPLIGVDINRKGFELAGDGTQSGVPIYHGRSISVLEEPTTYFACD